MPSERVEVMNDRAEGELANSEIASELASKLAIAPTTRDVVCEHCGSDHMIFVSQDTKPSWRDVLGYGSTASPTWYQTLRDAADQRFWDAAMGEGFNDCYLNTLTESAKATRRPLNRLL